MCLAILPRTLLLSRLLHRTGRIRAALSVYRGVLGRNGLGGASLDRVTQSIDFGKKGNRKSLAYDEGGQEEEKNGQPERSFARY